MRARRFAVTAAAALAVAGGTGAAIAATSGNDGKKAEDNVLRDAAKDLDVSPDKLRDALRDAGAAELDRELDRAVKAGDLTKKQAAEIKARHKRSGRVLGIGPGPGHGPRGLGFAPGAPPHGPGFRMKAGPRGGPLADLAKALGISRAKLLSELRDGKTVAQIAKAQGKSLDEVKEAVKASAKARLDKAVKNGDLTEKQAKRMLDHLEERLDHLGSELHLGPPPGLGGPGGPGGLGHGPGPGPDGMRR